MLNFILEGRLLRGLARIKFLKIAVLVLFFALISIVLIYTCNLFLTLPERTSGHHVQHHSSR